MRSFFRTALILSLSGHAAFLLFFLLGGFLIEPRDHVLPMAIPVDIVQIAEVTNTQKSTQPTPKPVTPVAAPPPVKTPPSPPEEKPVPIPAEKQIKTSEKKDSPPLKADVKPEEMGAKKPEKISKPKDKPQEKSPKSSESETKDDIASILKTLKDVKPTPRPPSSAPSVALPTVPTTVGTPSSVPGGAETLTISEMDALKRQLISCWNFPAGAKDAQNLIVDIIVEVNPDRTVKSAQIINLARTQTDTFYRSAAEAARRAVLKCQPLQLPVDRYTTWQKITIQFDPKELL